MELRRDGVLDTDETKNVEVKSFAEATFVLVEYLSATAEQNWSVGIIEEWLKGANVSFDQPVTVTKQDQEWEYTFRYEV